VALAQKVNNEFTALTQGSPIAYIDSVYLSFERHIEHGHEDIEILKTALNTVAGFQDTLENCADTVLQVSGVGQDWNLVNDIYKPVKYVIRVLQEMMCEAMLDPNELLAAYRTCSLSFQTK
jgi:hypothetical protein